MSNASKFRKRAVEYEQLKQFDRAVTSYVRAIEENESAREEVDVALFNKVGDLTLRQGRVTEAVTYYERAVEHYVNGGLFDNAIALCNKILRNAPGRSNVYFTLGRICGRKGLRSDATRNFLEYATRMQGEGRVDEGMRALAEIADLMPELTEVGRIVQEHAARAGIALPERRHATPPAAAPVQQTNAAGQAFGLSKNLVFLDIEYDAPASNPPVVAAAGVPASALTQPTPDVPAPGTLIEDLMLFDPADTAEARESVTAPGLARVDGRSIIRPFVDPATPLPALPDLEPTEDVATAGYAQELNAIPALPELLQRGVSRTRGEDASGSELFDANDLLADSFNGRNDVNGAAELPDLLPMRKSVESDKDAGRSSVDENPAAFPRLEPRAQESSAHLDEVLDGFRSEDHLHVPAEHISANVAVVTDAGMAVSSDRVDAIDLHAMLAAPENQVAHVDDLESEEFSGASDEVVTHRFARMDNAETTVPADLFDASDELPPLIFPMPFDAYPFKSVESMPDAKVKPEHDALFTDPVSFDNAYELPAFDVPAFDAPAFAPPAFDDSAFDDSAFDDSALDDSNSRDTSFESTAFETTSYDDIEFEAAGNDPITDATYEAPVATPTDRVTAPVYRIPDELPFIVSQDEFDSSDIVAIEDTSDLNALCIDTDVPTAIAAAEATAAASSRRNELREAVGESPADWTLRRRLAEALFEAGERDAAIIELSTALAGHEHAGALHDAAEIADELVRVAGDGISHHQKRVELAIRLSDQTRLREAYLDLADNLVRRGDDLRARAVYARVLEIDPWDDRARAALGDAAPPPPERIVAGSDNDHVDLAAWLRDDDEPQSTRLRMREPDMSGDEQEDFNSLLRAFKEGVARTMGEDDHDSHYDLGVAYKEMGLLDDAIGEFQKALRSRNNRLAAYEALGQCFLEQGSYKVAVTVLSRALHEPAIRDEQRVGVLYLLGYSCEVLHRFDEARSYFQRVYATDIHFRDVAQRLADLERLTR